jgi:hypothetical protein
MLVHWMLIVGMMWQFLVSLAILRREPGGLHWPSMKHRLWLPGITTEKRRCDPVFVGGSVEHAVLQSDQEKAVASTAADDGERRPEKHAQ